MKVSSTKYGDMMFLENDQLVGRSLDTYGEVNSFKVEFLKKLTDKGDVVVDVGANIGSITIPLAKHVTSEGYVLAIEAHTFLYFMLCGNIALNQITNIQAFNRSVTDSSKGVCYFPSVDINGEVDLSQISLATLLNAKDRDGRKCDNPVASIAIDDVNLAKPKLIKVSVQGMELSVLNGCRRTIDRSTPLLYVNFADNREDILRFVEHVGYDWELHETPVYNPDNFKYHKVDVLNAGNSLNIFCYPKGGRPEVSDEFLVNLDESDDPTHQEIRELRDSIHGTGLQTVS